MISMKNKEVFPQSIKEELLWSLWALWIHWGPAREPPPEPIPVAAAVAEMLQDATRQFLACQDPKQRREHVRKRINQAAGLPADRDWWVAGKTADLVLQDRIELSWLEKQLANLARRRWLPPGDANHVGKPEAWLQRVVAKFCDKRGLPFHKGDCEGQTEPAAQEARY